MPSNAAGGSVTEILAIAAAILSTVTVLISAFTLANSAKQNAFAQLQKVVDALEKANGDLVQEQARTKMEVRYIRTSNIKLQTSVMDLIAMLEKYMAGEKHTRADKERALYIISQAKDEVMAAQHMDDEKDKTVPIPLALVKEALREQARENYRNQKQ